MLFQVDPISCRCRVAFSKFSPRNQRIKQRRGGTGHPLRLSENSQSYLPSTRAPAFFSTLGNASASSVGRTRYGRPCPSLSRRARPRCSPYARRGGSCLPAGRHPGRTRGRFPLPEQRGRHRPLTAPAPRAMMRPGEANGLVSPAPAGRVPPTARRTGALPATRRHQITESKDRSGVRVPPVEDQGVANHFAMCCNVTRWDTVRPRS